LPGPFLTGKEKSMADATLFCTGVFLEQILPNHFGWTYQQVFGACVCANGCFALLCFTFD
jgi:hypothetical protein